MTAPSPGDSAQPASDPTPDSTQPPWLIVSDLHLGNRRRSPSSVMGLKPLLEGIGHLIINGDVAEVHNKTRHTDAQRGIDDLRTMCDQAGVTLQFLAGNHDPFVSDQKYIRLFENQLLITHGDVFHDAIAPWCPSAHILEQFTNEVRRELTGPQSPSFDLRMRESMLACRRLVEQRRYQIERVTMVRVAINPLTTLRVLWYWGRYPKLATCFLDTFAPQTKFLVYGHTHQASITSRSGRTLINTGSFGFPCKAQAVRIDGRELSVHPIKCVRDVYRFAPRPVAQYEITPPSEQTSSSKQWVSSSSPSDHRPSDDVMSEPASARTATSTSTSQSTL